MDIFFLLLVLVSMFWVFSQLGMLVEVLLYIACIMLRYIPCTCRFFNAFTIKKMDFVRSLFYINMNTLVISVLQSAYVVGYSQSFISSSLYHFDYYFIMVDDILEVAKYLTENHWVFLH